MFLGSIRSKEKDMSWLILRVVECSVETLQPDEFAICVDSLEFASLWQVVSDVILKLA